MIDVCCLLFRFNYLSRPSSVAMIHALQLLNALKAIDETGLLNAPLGLQMAELPLPPMHAKALISSRRANRKNFLNTNFNKILAEFECSSEIATIVCDFLVVTILSYFIFKMAMLQIKDVFVQPTHARHKSEVSRRSLSVEEGDHLTALNIFSSFIEVQNFHVFINFMN
jgi:HrpA-like RNA helicase